MPVGQWYEEGVDPHPQPAPEEGLKGSPRSQKELGVNTILNQRKNRKKEEGSNEKPVST